MKTTKTAKTFQVTVFTRTSPLYLVVKAATKAQAARTAVAHIENTMLDVTVTGAQADAVQS